MKIISLAGRIKHFYVGDDMISSVLQKDIEYVISDNTISWQKLKGATVLITGATGLIGGALCHVLRCADKKYSLGLFIICLGRNYVKLKFLEEEGISDLLLNCDIIHEFSNDGIPDKIDYIFHCAAVTKSSEMISNPVGVISSSINGTENILRYSAKCSCKGFLYLSSMEVYGQTDLLEVNEKDLGYIDLLNIRSCYPESKRLCETLCISYMKQYGVPVKIARLAQTFGAGTPKDDTRVFAQFARSAINQNDILLRTDGSSRGNYCYLSETISGLLYIMLNGINGEVYNVANPSASCTILEMAEMVANDISGNIRVVIEDNNLLKSSIYAPKTGHRLIADKLKSLGWDPKIGIKEMYERLIEDWRETV